MKRILIIDGDRLFLSFLQRALQHRGFEIRTTTRGEEALPAVLAYQPDLLILDLFLADRGGLDICRQLREQGHSTLPILILTEQDEVDDKIAALNNGADDYITRPFHFEELIARMHAALRRVESIPQRTEHIQVGDLSLDPGSRHVWRNGRSIELTRREYDLLELLAQNAGHVLTKSRIFERVWGYDNDSGLEVIKVYVKYVRTKLNRGNMPDLIHAVRGIGYMLQPAAASAFRSSETRGCSLGKAGNKRIPQPADL